METELPTFHAALARFTTFLELNNVRRPTVRWIFREDVALRERSLLIRRLLPVERSGLAEDHDLRAVATAARGVVLGAEGIDDDAVYCTVYTPVSDGDAEQRQISGLKLAVRTTLQPVLTLEDAAWAKAVGSQTPAQRSHLDDRIEPAYP